MLRPQHQRILLPDTALHGMQACSF